jgi:hypothetical protein
VVVVVVVVVVVATLPLLLRHHHQPPKQTPLASMTVPTNRNHPRLLFIRMPQTHMAVWIHPNQKPSLNKVKTATRTGEGEKKK